ncbi:hypothetical protein K466DRAFT_608010 [Polyporus arcularius HHB13444]|uniref:Uncharacterized protein n=1 Tax=Polyporus arcularius HHB13444 TaxID=1314778 RepID=A0A5C3NLM8_9APHY|nr:hypothetical protein K466DRAFT_608010 [Polyporus arcularius HHB13444]
MAARALQVFRSLYGHGGQSPAQLAWTDLVHGMLRAGFSMRSSRGTRRRFSPPEGTTGRAVTVKQPRSGFFDRRAQGQRRFERVKIDYKFVSERL